MGSEWRTLKLIDAPLDIIDGDRGKNYPKQQEFGDSGYCIFLNAGNVTKDGFSFSQCSFIGKDRDKLLRKGKLHRYDVVLTTRGTVGNSAYYNDDVKFDHIRINSGMVILRSDKQKLLPRYLYLYIRSGVFLDQVESLRTGSAQPQLPIRDINRIEIPIPPLPEQRAIAHILGSLDDKIELNRRMNEILEAMARALFKSWFVDFDPAVYNAVQAGNPVPERFAQTAARYQNGAPCPVPNHIARLFPNSFRPACQSLGAGRDSELGEIPRGWEVKNLNEIASVIDCLHSKKPEMKDDGHLLIQVFNVGDTGILDFSNPYYISPKDYEVWIKRMEVCPGDLVITKTGRVGSVGQMPNGYKAAMGRNMVGIRAVSGITTQHFLKDFLLSDYAKSEINRNTNDGTILQSLHVKAINKLRAALPLYSIIQTYSDFIRPVHQNIEKSAKESRTLASLRDTLIPKLISGDLRIPDAEKFVEEAGLW